MTTSEMMSRMGITDAYDTALPQQWMDAMSQQHGFDYRDLYFNYVWLYDDKARICGRPFNVRGQYQQWAEANLPRDYWYDLDQQAKGAFDVDKETGKYSPIAFGPVNPLPFLSGLRQGCQKDRSWFTSDQAKAIMCVLLNMMFNGFMPQEMFQVWQGLADKRNEEVAV